jgi:twinkle protein
LTEDRTFVGHEPCPECGSSDALARYSDGSAKCFAEDCDYREAADGQGITHPRTRKKNVKGLVPKGAIKAIPSRKLTEKSCEKWDYTSGSVKGALFGLDDPKVAVQIANYHDPVTGEVVCQKLRTKDKEFILVGPGKKKPPLYGMHLWRNTKAPKVVITEGEIDAISVSQIQQHRWPVVSLPNGAQGAKNAITQHLEWLDKFDDVVLLFDNDEAGNSAAAKCAPLFAPGKCKIARLPLKDANEMLKADRGDEVVSAIWEAKAYRPDGIVTLADIRERLRKPPEIGLAWWSPTLTQLTGGRLWGKVYAFGAGTGVGKTDFLTQQMKYDVTELHQPIGIFSYEQQPEETAKRIAGKFAGKAYHVANAGWTPDELEQTLDQIEASGKVFFYDSFGATEWETTRSHIRWLHHNHGVRIFYIDNLTAFAAEADDEKKMLEQTMAQIAKLATELQIIIHIVSHLSTPEGTPHEEGGRVMIRHFKGSRAIGYWCSFMFGLERDTQADDKKERRTTTFRVLKDRHTGRSSGEKFYLSYNPDTANMFEIDAPDEAAAFGLADEKGDEDF